MTREQFDFLKAEMAQLEGPEKDIKSKVMEIVKKSGINIYYTNDRYWRGSGLEARPHRGLSSKLFKVRACLSCPFVYFDHETGHECPIPLDLCHMLRIWSFGNADKPERFNQTSWFRRFEEGDLDEQNIGSPAEIEEFDGNPCTYVYPIIKEE